MPVLSYIVTALVAYLLGSIPTGYLVAKARGVDIRTVGSGNIGATNAFRVLGQGLRHFRSVDGCVERLGGGADVALSVIGELLAGRCRSSICASPPGLAAILGHNFTCWLHFKGGKGVATSAGRAHCPGAARACNRSFNFHYSICDDALRFGGFHRRRVCVAIRHLVYTRHNIGLTAVMTAIGALVILKHRKNIQRLLNGTENRIQFKKKEAAP